MTSLWQDGLTITLDPGGSPTSLVADLVAIPLLTDVVTDEVRQCILVLSANDGKYITTAPIINQYDKIRIAHTDEDSNVFNEVFEVIKIIPRQTQKEGTKLELHLLDNAHNLQDIQYIKPHYSENPKNVAIDICNYYNAEKGSQQPLLTDYESASNALPHWILNNYDFGLNEDSCFDRLQEVVDKNAASGDAGGVFDFYETRFHTDESNEDLIHVKAFVSGSEPVTPITISSSNSLNVGESEAGVEAKKGTIVINWGSNRDGTLPIDFSRFRSESEAFDLHPGWVTDAPYLIGNKVKYNGSHYISTTNKGPGPNPPPPSAGWSSITDNSEFGNVITYSPWTRQKSALIKNSGANHVDSGGTSTEPYGESMFDGNLVVWDTASDNPSFRSWVHLRSNTSANINVLYLYNNSTSGQYRGLRVLVDQNFGAIGVPWNQNGGKDENQKDFSNAIVQHNGGKFTGSNEYKNWTVLYEAKSSAQNGFMCAVKDEGRVYVYDQTTKWANKAGDEWSNDCFHPYVSCTDDGGILATTSADTSFTANTQSAVKVVYEHSRITPAPLTGPTETKTASYHAAGAWVNFTLPYPENTYRVGTSYDVGDIYGGGIQGVTVKEPATIDSQNMHLTHNGYRGFNHGVESADFGPLGSLDFFIKHRSELIRSVGGVADAEPRGDLKWRCFLFDTSDNVMFQDFTLPHNGVWEAVSLPLSGFQTYIGRRPYKAVWDAFFPPKNLSPVNQFLWRNIKLICLQWQEPYDGDGRYTPWATSTNGWIANPLITGIFYNKARHNVWIDGLRFSKPLLAVTDSVSDRVITQQGKETPNTINYVQLLQDAKAELEKQKYQRRQYDSITSGKYDIKAGEAYFLKNANTVPTSDDSGTPNTMKLVAKKIEYSITKPRDGSGGFVRTIQGVRRLET